MWSDSAPRDAMYRRPKSLHHEICSRADSAASAMCGRSHASNSQPCLVVARLLFPGPHLWCFDANVPCGRASACLFAVLVLRGPASEKAALHSWPDNASLACLQYCIVHFSFLQTVTNVEFADLFSFLFPLLSFLHISSLGSP